MGSLKAMSSVKNILLTVAAIGVAYFAPVLAPKIGSFLGASGFLGKAIGSIVIAVGITAIQSVLMGGGRKTSMEASKINVRIPEPPRWLVAGNVRQGGGALFGEFDAAGNFWYIIVHGDSILVDLSDIVYFLDDMIVTVDASGNVLTKDFRLVGKDKKPANSDGEGDPYVQIWTRTYSTNDPTPGRVAELDAALGTKWTNDHRLVGTTYSVVKMGALKIEDRYKIYKWRGPFSIGEPSVSLVGKWTACYDPRDPSQTLDQPETYKFTRSAPLIWAWFRTHRYGRNKPLESINWQRIGEQATIADQTITGIAGTHTRYRCDIAIAEDKERVVAEQEIMSAMDAQIVFDDDGKTWVRVGHWETPTLRLTRNRDIVAMESVEAQNGESETQGVIVRYTDPDANYTVQPSAPWYNPLYYVPGKANTFLTVDVLSCQDHNQAMRLAKAIGLRSQPAHKILPTVGLRGLRARQERLLTLNYDNTFAGDYEIVTPVEVEQAGIFCGFGLVPVSSDRWTLLAGEEKAKPVITDYESVPLPDMPTDVVLTYVNSRIEATFTTPTRQDVSFQFQYILAANLSSDQWIDMTTQMQDQLAYSGYIPSGDYRIRWRSVSGAGRVSAYNTPYASLTASTPLSPATNLTVTGGAGSANIAWRNPNDLTFYFSDVYRGTTDVFSAATKITSNYPGGVGEGQAVTDTTTPGVYYYWVVSRSNDGSSATPTGPQSGTIT